MLTLKKLTKLDEKGVLNPLLIPLVIAVVLLIAASVMAVMYYSNYTQQKMDNQPAIDKAVALAEANQKDELEAEFTEREKVPTKTYKSPSELGSVGVAYPKTWSSYVVNKNRALDYYAHPNYVPSEGVNYALRMSVSDKAFATEVKSYDSMVKKGDLKATAIKVSGTTGTRLDGFLKKDQEGTLVIFPLRDKTLKVWTESKDYRGDFDNIVLKNLTFVP